MAQNITLLGASYSDVPAVTLPKTGGGTAQFDDTTDANATAEDILQGKTAYVNGAKIVGTGSGGGGGSEIIETTVINNSSGDVTFNSILQACEDADYTLTYSNCILRFRAKGVNACVASPNNYTYNNHTIVVKDGAVWNVNYNRCYYRSGKVSPDTFSGIQLYETNNQVQNSGTIIDANHKIKNTYASAFQGVGGSGTTVTLFEIPVDWSDFLTS